MLKYAKPLFAAALALAVVVGCQQQQAEETGATEETPAVDEAAVRQAIESAGTAWQTAALAGDAAAIAALYDEDAVLQPPNAPRQVGRTAIQAGLAEMLTATPITAMTISTDAVEVSSSGELAYAYGTYTSTNTMPDGAPIEDTGKWLSVFENYNGQWLYVADTWNSDLPIPGTEASANP
jgi:uncharacterized protein (TIGR02246 family)